MTSPALSASPETRDHQIVVAGLDGVIALIEHRLPLLYQEDGTKDWDRFTVACEDDLPNLPLIKKLQTLHDEGYGVVIITGRSSLVKKETLTWLANCGVPYDRLWLRPHADRRPADEFKKAILDLHYAGVAIRHFYESEHQLSFVMELQRRNIRHTLVGRNRGNAETNDLVEARAITHACDHVVLWPFYGDDSYEWNRVAADLAKEPCKVCSMAAFRKKQAECSCQAATLSKQRGLPPLEGSDQQVAWAETVRYTAFMAIDLATAWLADVAPQFQQNDPDQLDAIQTAFVRSIEYLENKIAAKWWIDHRTNIHASADCGRALLSAVAENEGYL